jgi:hypothetical protein
MKEMSFRSEKSKILALLLLIVGGYQLMRGWSYFEAASREVTTVGTISRVIPGGRSGPTYEYSFEVNGVKISDDSGTCRTPLSSRRCKEGAQVLVYYDPDHLSETLLQEFGEAGRQRLFFGAWMAGCGLLLIALYFFLNRAGSKPSNDDRLENDEDKPESDVIHIVPSE